MKKLLSVLLSLSLLLCALPAALAYDSGVPNRGNTVSMGLNHSGAIDASGGLWMWGSNDRGQVGNGGKSKTADPVKVLDDVVSVSLGNEHSAAIKSDGSLWAWGANTYGQVGNGATKDAVLPVKITDGVVAVSLGYRHSAALKADGTLWTWGLNAQGQLGDGTENDCYAPRKVLEGVICISMGGDASAAVKTDGSLWMWGDNLYDELGFGSSLSYVVVPTKIMDGVASVSLGDGHSAAVKTDGSLWVWGQNDSGQVGNGGDYNAEYPVHIMDDVAAVSAGGRFTAALQTDGSLWLWGSNNYGQLGDGEGGNRGLREMPPYRDTPSKLMEGVAAVSLGCTHAAVVKTDGTLWLWGRDDYAQIGSATMYDAVVGVEKSRIQTVPVQLSALQPKLPGPFTIQTAAPVTPDTPITPAPNPGTPAVTEPTTPNASGGTVPQASTQTVMLDGRPTIFYTCLLSGAGGATNYVKIRDVAAILDGTAAQFNVDWLDGAIAVQTKTPYTTRSGQDLSALSFPNAAVGPQALSISVDGAPVPLEAVVISGSSFFKLRDLGAALGFGVDWDGAIGRIVITTE